MRKFKRRSGRRSHKKRTFKRTGIKKSVFRKAVRSCAETKYFDITIAPANFSSASVVAMLPASVLTQGTTRHTRIGNEIFLQKIHMHMVIDNINPAANALISADLTVLQYRLSIIWPKDYMRSSTSGSDNPATFYTKWDPDVGTIMLDQYFTIGTVQNVAVTPNFSDANLGRPLNRHKKTMTFNKKMKWNDLTQTIQQAPIFYLTSNTTLPFIYQVTYRVYYKDL